MKYVKVRKEGIWQVTRYFWKDQLITRLCINKIKHGFLGFKLSMDNYLSWLYELTN